MAELGMGAHVRARKLGLSPDQQSQVTAPVGGTQAWDDPAARSALADLASTLRDQPVSRTTKP